MWLRRLATAVVLLAISGCGLYDDSYYYTSPHSYAMDGVKLIGPDLTRGEDPTTMLQPHYQLGANRRLLLRFESFDQHINEVSTAVGDKVEVEITLQEEPGVIDLNTFELCPITRQWMMLATWWVPNPFQKSHRWENGGGDIDRDLCAHPQLKSHTSTVTFDVTRWFTEFARSHHENFGFVLIAQKTIHVVGEYRSISSPKIIFQK